MSQIHDTFSNIALTEDQKAAWASNLAEAALEQDRKVVPLVPRRRRPRASVLLAAAFAAALGVGGLAYAVSGSVSLSDFAAHLFGGEAPKTEQVGQVGRELQSSATSNGVTVSADAVFGDEHYFAAVFSITREGGFPLEAQGDDTLPYQFDKSDVTVPGCDSYSGYCYFYDADPADDSIQYVVAMNVSGSEGTLQGKAAKVRLANLGRYTDRDFTEYEELAHGTWDLSFRLDYEDATRKLPTGQTFPLAGGTARVDALSLSPLSLGICYTSDKVVDAGEFFPNGSGGCMNAETGQIESSWTADGNIVTLTEYAADGSQTVSTIDISGMTTPDQLLDLGTVTFVLADGTEIAIRNNGGGALRDDPETATTKVEKTLPLPTIVDPEDVVAIVICGERFTL